MVDIHSHILWDIDDGAAGVAESVAMLEEAWQSGTTDIVATPHWNSRYEYQVDLTEERIEELAARTGGRPRIHRGCEVHLAEDSMERLLEAPGRYTIDGGPYLLVEAPHKQFGKEIDEILRRLLAAGLSPVVAHPERNPVLQKKLDLVEAWVDAGCFMQLTALSITGGFGASAQRACGRLLARGLAHVVASDAHDPVRRHIRMDEAYHLIRDRHGEECAAALFDANPRDMVNGVRIAAGRLGWGQAAAPWWRFWQS